MFWSKKETVEKEREGVADKVAIEAEGLYRSGKMHCAEAVLMAVRNNFRPEVPAEAMHLAAGFGGGSGTGCICGAVAGATMAFGLVLPDDKKRVKELTKELHHWFKEEYGVLCCRVLTAKGGKSGCPLLTGQVAGKAAELLGT
jgi:C_GCAxxG_C_C family probable redox protein